MLVLIFVKAESSSYMIYWGLVSPASRYTLQLVNSFFFLQRSCGHDTTSPITPPLNSFCSSSGFKSSQCENVWACSWARQRPASWIQTNISEPKMVWCVALHTGRRTPNLQRGQCLVQSETKTLPSMFFLHQRLKHQTSIPFFDDHLHLEVQQWLQ